MATSKWEMYDRLIDGIPEGIAVKDAFIGFHWVGVEAECGLGLGMVSEGNSSAFGILQEAASKDLKQLASYAKSWNFIEASIGVAAMNAWYSARPQAEALGMKIEAKGVNDGLDLYRSLTRGKKVTVIGHFPMVERLADECELTVLERRPHGNDLPDPACEFIIPEQDFTFITGVTLINKTLPRLLELVGESNGSAIMVGPSVVPSAVLYDYGVDCMAGAVVDDAAAAKHAIMKGATSEIFKFGVQKMRIERPGWL